MAFIKVSEYNNITSLSEMKDRFVDALTDIGFEVYNTRRTIDGTESWQIQKGYEIFAENVDIGLCLNFRVTGAEAHPTSDRLSSYDSYSYIYGSIACKPADDRVSALSGNNFNDNPLTTLRDSYDYSHYDIPGYGDLMEEHASIHSAQIITYNPLNTSLHVYLRDIGGQYCAIIRTSVPVEEDGQGRIHNGQWHTMIIGKLNKTSQYTQFIASSQGGVHRYWSGFSSYTSPSLNPFISSPNSSNIFFNHGGYNYEPDMKGWLVFHPLDNYDHPDYISNNFTLGFSGRYTRNDFYPSDFPQVNFSQLLSASYDPNSGMSHFIPIVFSYIGQDNSARMFGQLKDVFLTVNPTLLDQDTTIFMGDDEYLLLSIFHDAPVSAGITYNDFYQKQAIAIKIDNTV